jgi:hypothetical protein
MLTQSALMWTWVAAAICTFLTASVAYGIFRLRTKMRGGKGWPVVPGQIISSQVEQPQFHDSDDDVACTVNIRYRYRVGPMDYEGDRIDFGGGALKNREQAQKLTAKYPVGARVPVHYDPRTPAMSVLEPQAGSSSAALIVMLIVFGAIATVLIAHAIAGKVITTEGGTPLFVFLVPLALICFGILAIGAYLKLRQERLASARWPTVKGKITHSGLVTEISTDTDDDGHTRSRETYRADIRFAYRVGGRDFNSNHWNWGWTALHSQRSTAEAIVARYPSGSDVTVYYDAAEPGTAVLDPANKAGVAAPLVVGIICLMSGFVFLWGFTHLQLQQ